MQEDTDDSALEVKLDVAARNLVCTCHMQLEVVQVPTAKHAEGNRELSEEVNLWKQDIEQSHEELQTLTKSRTECRLSVLTCRTALSKPLQCLAPLCSFGT